MIKVTAGQSIYEVEEGTTLEQLAKQLQKKEEPVILLAYMDGKLTELFTEIKKDCHVRFVTLKEQAGYMAYKRTATFIFLKACEDLLGKGESTKIAIDYSIGNSIFCDFSSMERIVDDKFAHSIQKRMEQLYESDLPITKRSLDTDQASRYFDSVGLKGKRELFKFRRESKTNIYSMDGYDNYFYGYMAPSTGYIPTFLVSVYQHGVVLQIPKRKQTEEIVPFTPQPKLFHVMQRSREWTKTMGVDTVGALNDEITYGNINHLILLQEGLQEKLLADISDEIVSKNKRIILIAGPSSSGKTTFSHRLSIQLEIAGLTPHPVSMDDYFQNRLETADENGVEYEDNDSRAIFYARGVLETVKKLRWCPDIIHCHGWMTALAPLYIKKAYKDEPSFRDAKVVFSVFEDDFKESFNADFVNRLVLKGVTKKDVAHLKAPVDYATLCKLAIDYADGIIQQSEKVNEEVMEYARQSGKPILEYQTPETFADACNEFYDRVWETEQK